MRSETPSSEERTGAPLSGSSAEAKTTPPGPEQLKKPEFERHIAGIRISASKIDDLKVINETIGDMSKSLTEAERQLGEAAEGEKQNTLRDEVARLRGELGVWQERHNLIESENIALAAEKAAEGMVGEVSVSRKLKLRISEAINQEKDIKPAIKSLTDGIAVLKDELRELANQRNPKKMQELTHDLAEDLMVLTLWQERLDPVGKAAEAKAEAMTKIEQIETLAKLEAGRLGKKAAETNEVGKIQGAIEIVEDRIVEEKSKLRNKEVQKDEDLVESTQESLAIYLAELNFLKEYLRMAKENVAKTEARRGHEINPDEYDVPTFKPKPQPDQFGNELPQRAARGPKTTSGTTTLRKQQPNVWGKLRGGIYALRDLLTVTTETAAEMSPANKAVDMAEDMALEGKITKDLFSQHRDLYLEEEGLSEIEIEERTMSEIARLKRELKTPKGFNSQGTIQKLTQALANAFAEQTAWRNYFLQKNEPSGTIVEARRGWSEPGTELAPEERRVEAPTQTVLETDDARELSPANKAIDMAEDMAMERRVTVDLFSQHRDLYLKGGLSETDINLRAFNEVARLKGELQLAEKNGNRKIMKGLTQELANAFAEQAAWRKYFLQKKEPELQSATPNETDVKIIELQKERAVPGTGLAPEEQRVLQKERAVPGTGRAPAESTLFREPVTPEPQPIAPSTKRLIPGTNDTVPLADVVRETPVLVLEATPRPAVETAPRAERPVPGSHDTVPAADVVREPNRTAPHQAVAFAPSPRPVEVPVVPAQKNLGRRVLSRALMLAGVPIVALAALVGIKVAPEIFGLPSNVEKAEKTLQQFVLEKAQQDARSDAINRAVVKSGRAQETAPAIGTEPGSTTDVGTVVMPPEEVSTADGTMPTNLSQENRWNNAHPVNLRVSPETRKLPREYTATTFNADLDLLADIATHGITGYQKQGEDAVMAAFERARTWINLNPLDFTNQGDQEIYSTLASLQEAMVDGIYRHPGTTVTPDRVKYDVDFLKAVCGKPAWQTRAKKSIS